MSKIMKNVMLLGLKISLILGFGLFLVPMAVQAEGGKNYTFGTFETDYGEPTPPDPVSVNNPKPIIRSLNPNSGNRGAGHATITITGTGFVPSSVAKVNGMNRPTTYIDGSHLLVQVDLNEPYRTEDGFYVTVWNSAPGGGSSNSAFFKLEGAAPAPLGVTGYDPYSYGYGGTPGNPESYYESGAVPPSSLASSVILGGPTFLPSSLVQWILLAIIVLIIIILVRKVFGARVHYDTTPLKHA